MYAAQTKLGKYFATLTATAGWIAILLQLYLIVLNRTTTLPETIVRYFSFFTIESNILATICFTFLCLQPQNKAVTFFKKSNIITAVTLYFLIVGIVHNLVLRFLLAPYGYQRIADELLHTINPILVIIYWLFFANKSDLRVQHLFSRLIFPAMFLIYTLIRGSFVNYYPYPFLDVTALGYPAVLQNSFFIILAFLLIG